VPTPQQAREWLKEHALLVAMCLASVLPIFVVRFPPMQDFPVHVATIRVLHDFHDPHFGFDADYELTLGRTQYIGFYALGHLLAFVAGPRGAAMLLVCFYLAGTILALRSLLIALGRDERLCFAVIPGLYGATFAIGLMTYLCAFPVTIFGITQLVRRRLEPNAWRHGLVAILGLALFYLHVVHLGIFLLAALVFFPWRASNRTRAAAAASFVPCGAALLWWLTMTNVGRRIFEVSKAWGTKNRPPLDGALLDMVPWTSDAYLDMSDEITFGVLLLALAFATVLAFRTRAPSSFAVRFYWVVPLVLFLLYVTGERARGPIWPLGQRYMLPTFMLGIPLFALPVAARERRWATIAIVAAALATIGNVTWHFVAFNREVGDFPQALAQMEEKKHVAALMYRTNSVRSRFSPFLHFGSYYQAEKGGVVLFTFAGYDQWPFDFKRGRYPLFDGPATPRWEFFPSAAAEHQPLASYFDYVLTRDRGSSPAPRGFRLKWRGDRWEVYEREPPR
jgi:hypothetical protein